MKLGKFLRECCPESTEQIAQRLYQRVQNNLVKLRAEARILMTNAEWSTHHQKQTEGENVIDVNEVGKKTRYRGRMDAEKFKQLAKEERDEWIEFNNRLLDCANDILRDSETNVQHLHSLKEIMALLIEPIEQISHSPSTRVRIHGLRDSYIRYAKSVKSDGRIRLRYLRILNASHNEKMLEQWDVQLQREFQRTLRHPEIFAEFIDSAKSVVDEVIADKESTAGWIDSQKRRHDASLIKSKRDILKNRMTSHEDQAESWKARAESAADEQAVTEAKRRHNTYAACAALYKDCFETLDRLHEHYLQPSA